jgi:hypothetical protein
VQEASWEAGLISTPTTHTHAYRTRTDGCRDYDEHGPAGPTAFWKVTDELAEEKTSSMPLAYF